MVKEKSLDSEDFRFSEFGKKLEQREEKEANLVFGICSKCGKRKPAFLFSRDKRNTFLGGRKRICKTCRIILYMNYYRENRSEILVKNKTYRDKNKRDRSKYYKNWQKDNKAYLKEKARKWYEANKEKIKARNLQYFRDHKQACLVRRKLWIEKNKEKIKKYNRKYRQKHNK